LRPTSSTLTSFKVFSSLALLIWLSPSSWSSFNLSNKSIKSFLSKQKSSAPSIGTKRRGTTLVWTQYAHAQVFVNGEIPELIRSYSQDEIHSVLSILLLQLLKEDSLFRKNICY